MTTVTPVAFTKDFTRQESITEEAIEKAIAVLRSGKLHRYNTAPGEEGETALLEQEFAAYMGKRFCLACTSCGSAMYLALKSAGVKRGDTVLCNAFTLAPVPGAIENTGANIELVDINEDYTIDLKDLARKAHKAHFLLLSHMRGHIADMDRVVELCNYHDLQLIEDCAHTMGATWDGRKSGSFGHAACFSTQTYKHINSGEGGLLVTDDDALISRAIIYSGSYMLYEKHVSRPHLDKFEEIRELIPNYSCRMDNLRAAILRPQLKTLDRQCDRWNTLYRILEERLKRIPGIACYQRPSKEGYVGSSIQFSLLESTEEQIRRFLARCESRGVHIKWFGNKRPVGFTSAYYNWKYFNALPEMNKTTAILAAMCDMRIPLTFDAADCHTIADIIEEELNDLAAD